MSDKAFSGKIVQNPAQYSSLSGESVFPKGAKDGYPETLGSLGDNIENCVKIYIVFAV